MKKLLYILLIVPFLQYGCLSVSLDVAITSEACFFTEDSVDLYLFTNGLPVGKLPQYFGQTDSLLLFEGLMFPLHEELNESATEHYFIAREDGKEETVAEGIVSVSSGDISVSTLKGSFEVEVTESCTIIVIGR